MEKQSEVTEVKSTTDPTNTLTDKISQLDLYNPDNLSPKIESFPSVLIQPPLSPVPNYSDSFVSITSSSLLKQTFISGTRYPDNSASLGEAILQPINGEDVAKDLIEAAKALLQGRDWTHQQKNYFNELIEAIVIPNSEAKQTLKQVLTEKPQALTQSPYAFFKTSLKRQTGRLLCTLTDHEFSVMSLLLLPNREVVSGSMDRTLKVWDMKTGKCVKTLKEHKDGVNSLLLLPSGEVVSSSEDFTLKIWDIKTGACVKTLRGHSSAVRSLLLLPNGNVMSSSLDKTLRVWDMKTGECVKTLTEHECGVNCLLLLPNGDIMSGSSDKTIKVWNIKTGECVKTLRGDTPVANLLLLPNGEMVSIGGYGINTLKLWDMKMGQCVKTLTGHKGYVNCLLLLPNGDVVSGSSDKTLKVWDMKTGQCVKTLTGHEYSVYSLLLLPSGEVVSGSEDKTLKVWDISLEKTFEELETKAPECKQM